MRQLNEDAVVVGTHLWAVADGMGGHAAGDVASALVARSLEALDRPDLTLADLQRCIESASHDIVDYAVAHPESAGLGTTLSGVAEVLIGGVHHWAVFNVGDSRVYRYFDAGLSRATIDHSEVEEMVMSGQLSENDARTHPLRNVITRSLGSTPPPVVDLWVLPQTSGERFLICSDGLTSEVDDAVLAQALQEPELAEVAASLVDAALSAGGRDNVSVVVLDIEGPTDGDADGETNPHGHHVRDED